jgi:hypothetical protein
MTESNSTSEDVLLGEIVAPEWSFRWIVEGQVDAGTMIAPAKLNSELARRFADLHLVIDDLSFALDCLTEADKLGMPDPNNLASKALIFSGAVAYARCFHSGVRSVRLNPQDFVGTSVPFDHEIHDYVFELRNKHVAHSVNEFERCVASAVVVRAPKASWVARGIGVTIQKNIGISRAQLRRAASHIGALRDHLLAEVEALRLTLFEEFTASFREGGGWKMVPILRKVERTKVAKRRPD